VKSKIVEANMENTDDEGVLRYRRDDIRTTGFGTRSRPKQYTNIVKDVIGTFFNNDD